MINFLRRVRRNMMTDNKLNLYVVYAIGEVVLVVIGILVALQIDNWNENQRIRNIEQQYLLALKEEFEYNKAELASVMNLNKKNTDYALKISDHAGPGNPEITEKEFETLAINAFASEVHYNPNQGVLDEIISSGKLGIFSNDELKFALSSWSAVLDRALWQEKTHEKLRVEIVEMTRVNGNIRSMTFEWGEQFNIKPTKFNRGNLQLLKSEEYDNRVIAFILTGRFLNEGNYAKLEEEIDRILSRIDDEIDL
ncbi:MAG: DUF6090 family protein [Bacteroidota bacterium]